MMYTGEGAIQWEHSRQWTFSAVGSEFCRADGALVVGGGFASLSIFLRRESQTAGSTFELKIHTTPIYLKLLDEPITSANAAGLLFPLNTGTGLQPNTNNTAQIFGARVAADQAMGTVLFWEMKNSGQVGTFVGDIYVVPNYTGVIEAPPLVRTVDLQTGRRVSGRPTLRMQ